MGVLQRDTQEMDLANHIQLCYNKVYLVFGHETETTGLQKRHGGIGRERRTNEM